MKSVFITGTDTGVGKTTVTALLGRYLADKGYKAATQKWIETGCREKLEGTPAAPYRFRVPCSPHLASGIEKRSIDPDKIVKSFRSLAGKNDFVIVEGIGGALVPFNEKDLVIDIAVRLKLPVLVVAQNKLGAINHTLLTVEALRKRKLNIMGIIFNDIKGEDSRIARDNPSIIRSLTAERVLGILPWTKDWEKLYGSFCNIGDKILSGFIDAATLYKPKSYKLRERP
ncbi:MAG: dethiobiotin synthase [Candidatus Omnitrophica bacterium]|nr:dethiobiotin synthase [Candidatus Omnitrophota bacterium]MDD5552300.1 dethiobiotin synthase [Candidatus Omnitrophota bacterium]